MRKYCISRYLYKINQTYKYMYMHLIVAFKNMNFIFYIYSIEIFDRFKSIYLNINLLLLKSLNNN